MTIILKTEGLNKVYRQGGIVRSRKVMERIGRPPKLIAPGFWGVCPASRTISPATAP